MQMGSWVALARFGGRTADDGIESYLHCALDASALAIPRNENAAERRLMSVVQPILHCYESSASPGTNVAVAATCVVGRVEAGIVWSSVRRVRSALGAAVASRARRYDRLETLGHLALRFLLRRKTALRDRSAVWEPEAAEAEQIEKVVSKTWTARWPRSSPS